MSHSQPTAKGRRGVLLLVALLGIVAAALLAACGGETKTETSPASSNGGVSVAGTTVSADAAIMAAVPQKVKDSGTLRVATDVPYPPFEMWADAGKKQATGFDYDLGQALAAKMGLKFEFSDIVFDTLIPALGANKADLVLAAMVDNPDRQKKVDFIDYATVGSVLLTKKGNPNQLSDLNSLAGKACAAQKGTIQAQMLTDLKAELAKQGKQLTVLTYPKDSDALLAVKSGKAAANLVQLPNAAYTVKTAGDGAEYEIIVDPANVGGYKPSIIGAAVAKNNTEMRDVTQKALQALIDDGTYTKILAAYGLENSAVKTADINKGK